MRLLSKFRRWFMIEGDSVPLYQPPTWQPIATAPDGEHILLGWSEGDEEFDYLITAGQLHAGEWIDGPGPQPDWWMSEPDLRYREPIANALNDATLVLLWERENEYDFDVGELSDGIWRDGPEQPTGWVSVGGPPRLRPN